MSNHDFMSVPQIKASFEKLKFEYTKEGIYKALNKLQEYSLVDYQDLKWSIKRPNIDNFLEVRGVELNQLIESPKNDLKIISSLKKKLK